MAAPERHTGLPSASQTDKPGSITPSLYQELHRIAVRKMRYERRNHTLQPTALVNEAYLRLAAIHPIDSSDRVRLLALSAHVMRNILVDHARSNRAHKRGAGAMQITYDDDLQTAPAFDVEVLAVDDALKHLAKLDCRQAEILELIFFAGMTFEEIASALQISVRTAKRESSMGRAWMRGELSRKP